MPERSSVGLELAETEVRCEPGGEGPSLHLDEAVLYTERAGPVPRAGALTRGGIWKV